MQTIRKQNATKAKKRFLVNMDKFGGINYPTQFTASDGGKTNGVA